VKICKICMDFCVWKFCVSQNPVRSLIIIHIIFIHIICFGKTKKKSFYRITCITCYSHEIYTYMDKLQAQEKETIQNSWKVHLTRDDVHGVTANFQLCKSYRLFSEPHSTSQQSTCTWCLRKSPVCTSTMQTFQSCQA